MLGRWLNVRVIYVALLLYLLAVLVNFLACVLVVEALLQPEVSVSAEQRGVEPLAHQGLLQKMGHLHEVWQGTRWNA